jgi:capsular exopolysaccharide synthesis family protein
MSTDPLFPNNESGGEASLSGGLDAAKSQHGERRISSRMLDMHRSAEGIDFRRIFFLLLKRLWIIALIVIIGTVVLIRMFTGKPRMYEAQAILEVQPQEEKVLKAENVIQESPGTGDFINTVVLALTSRNILLRVIKENNLTKDPHLYPPKKGGGSYSEDQLCDILQSHYRVLPMRGSRLIQILGRDSNPKTAAMLTQSLLNAFIHETYQRRSSASRMANEFLSDEAAKLKEKLQQSESALQHYKEENNAVSLEQNQNIIVEKLRQVSGMVTQAQDARLKIEADIEQFRRTDPKNIQDLLTISSIAALPQVTEARTQLQTAQADFNTLKQRYMYRHPQYIAAATKIHDLQERLRMALENAGVELGKHYEKSQETENKLQSTLKEQEEKALQLNKLAIPYNVLTREVESDRALYESVVNRMKETGVKASEESAPYRILEEAMVPSSPMPNASIRWIFVGFMVLLGGSIAAVMIHDRLSSTIRSVDEAENLLDHPVLGSIPDEKIKGDLSTSNAGTDPSIKSKRSNQPRIKYYPISVAEAPNSSIAESYRSLRTSIMLLDSKLDTKTLMFTSAIPAEGKTFCTLNTAAAFAILGKKTVIVDADLRRPALQHALLNGEVTAGLSDYLSGQVTLEEVLTPTKIPNLSFLSAGHRSTIPAELLASKEMDDLLVILRSRFDRVIIDSAPIHAVSDSLILASKVPTTAMVIRTESTSLHAIRRAMHLLRDTDTQVAGLILNRMKRRGSGYYYYYYYGRKYQDYRSLDGSPTKKA